MGQGSSSERRRRRQQITDEATASIMHENPTHSMAIAVPSLGMDGRMLQAVRVNQMKRGHHAFTKADLIALLCKLKGIDVSTCSQMTCDDLRLAIRVALYAEDNSHDVSHHPVPSAPPAYAIEDKPQAFSS